jgi:hypothetical protein
MFKNKKTIYYQGAADKTEKLIRQRNTRQSNFILGNFLKVSAKNTNPNGLQILKHLEVVSFRKLIVSPEDYLQKQRGKKSARANSFTFKLAEINLQ